MYISSRVGRGVFALPSEITRITFSNAICIIVSFSFNYQPLVAGTEYIFQGTIESPPRDIVVQCGDVEPDPENLDGSREALRLI